jgi:hypothetical protein
MVDPRDGDENYEGSTVHLQIARTLVDFMGAYAPDEGLPKTPEGVPADYVLPKQSEWMVNFFVAWAKETIPDDWSLQVECSALHEFARFILSGHLDLLAISQDCKRAIGADWKTVYNAVPEAKYNNQVLGYIVLMFLIYSTLEEITFYIIQPRINEEDAERVSWVTLNREELVKAVAYLEAEINAALDDPMTVNNGPHCTKSFCPFATQCAAIKEELQHMKVTYTPEMLARIKAVPDDETLASLVVSAKTVERVIKDSSEMIKDRLEKVGRINSKEGTTLTLEIRKGRWSLNEGQEVPMFQAAKATLPEERIAKCVTFSKGSLEEEMADALNIPKGGKSSVTAEKLFLEKFATYYTQGTSRVLKFG